MAEAQETNGWGPGNQTNKCDIPALMEREENAPPQNGYKTTKQKLGDAPAVWGMEENDPNKVAKVQSLGQGRIRAHKKFAIVLQLANGEKIATQRVGDTHGLREREANDQTQ